MKFDIDELIADYVKAGNISTDFASHTELVDCFQEQSVNLMKEIDNFATASNNIFNQVEMAKIVMESLEKVLREGWETCHPEDAALHYDEGYRDGRDDGYNEGYDDGQDAAWAE